MDVLCRCWEWGNADTYTTKMITVPDNTTIHKINGKYYFIKGSLTTIEIVDEDKIKELNKLDYIDLPEVKG